MTITPNYINAIINEGAIELTDYSGTWQREIAAGDHTIMAVIYYTITYSQARYNYFGEISPSEPLDACLDIELTISDAEGDVLDIPARMMDRIETQIRQQIILI